MLRFPKKGNFLVLIIGRGTLRPSQLYVISNKSKHHSHFVLPLLGLKGMILKKKKKSCMRETLNLSMCAESSSFYIFFISCHVSGVRCWVSGVTCGMSHVTCHISLNTNSRRHGHLPMITPQL